MRQLILELRPQAGQTLENFVAGSNADVLTGLAAWLAPGNREPALLLYGDKASGKTHLLRASGGAYCDAAACPDLAQLAPDAAFIAVDNVEALDAAGQIALFNHFNRLRAAAGRLLAAAQRPPLQLQLREDLRTRLGSALIYRLHPLSDAEKIAALAAQAEARGLTLPAEALAYLLARAPRDMRSLSSILAALDRYSLEQQRPITLPLLREVLHATPELNLPGH